MENSPGASAPPTNESVGRARGAASDAIGEIKQTAKETAGLVQDKTRTAFEGAQSKAAEQGRSAAMALRDTADRLNGELPWMDNILRKSADGLEQVTQSFGQGDMNQALTRVSDFARRQPALFLGISVALGFALARVGKTMLDEAAAASARTPEQPGMQQAASAGATSDQAASATGEAVSPYAPTPEV